MAFKRLPVKKILLVLRLFFECGLSGRAIARSINASPSTVGDYVRRARAAGLSWPLPDGMDEAKLEALLFPAPHEQPRARPLPDWRHVHQELRRKGVAQAIIDGALDERGGGSRPGEDGGIGAGAATSMEAEVQAARRLLDGRSTTLGREADPRRRRQKAYALLARHGFPPDVCRTLAASVVPTGDLDDEGV